MPRTSRRNNKSPRTFTHADRQRLDRAADLYLRRCYKASSAARASEFAAHLDLTPEYVSWLAAKILGKSLQKFLREKQLAYAARLLTTGPLSIEDVSIQSGFGTPGTFYRWFIAAYGMPPGAFRELKK